ncbi:Os06g0341801, partial [Oryza sativa Japonica Group]
KDKRFSSPLVKHIMIQRCQQNFWIIWLTIIVNTESKITAIVFILSFILRFYLGGLRLL